MSRIGAERGHRKLTRWQRLQIVSGLAAALVVGLPAVMASAAVGPIPPFLQCPAVGQAPSCTILIVINSDRSVSVFGDGVGPYDGQDDTLVGVQNNSSIPVDAITVSGPTGSDLFGFDSDGLCTFANCTNGPTGYEGPGISFVTDPTTNDRGEVDFTGGLAASKSAYFSLEGVLNAAALVVRQGRLNNSIDYVALGDSYSSGEGAIDSAGDPSFTPDTNLRKTDECHRSLNAYPELLSTEPTINAIPAGYVFAACSGARVANFVKSLPGSGGWNESPQLDQIAAPGTTNNKVGLVTLSVGGNDAGFASDLLACVHGLGRGFSGCGQQISNRLGKGLVLLTHGGRVKYDTGFFDNIDDWHFCSGCKASKPGVVDVPSLDQLYAQVGKRAPSAQILVMGYPELFPEKSTSSCVVGDFVNRLKHHLQYKLDPREMSQLYNAEVTLNATIKAEVARAQKQGVNVSYVNTFDAFKGHGPCDTPTGGSQWINGAIFQSWLNQGASPWSFHPNAVGQAQLERLMLAAVKA